MTNPVTNPSRRRFIRNSAMLAVGSALAANSFTFAGVSASSPKPISMANLAQVSDGDLAILNYALTLEHLEAKAYAVINASGLLSGTAAAYFKTFGGHESTHVDVLTKTIKDLGGTPVQALASYNFPKLNNQQEVLQYFHDVEELGAAAYLGQAPRLQNADLITAAVSIHNVEAQHAAALGDLIGVSPSPVFGTPKTMEEVLAVVTPILMPANSMPTQMPGTGGGGSQHHFSGMRAL